MSDEKDDLWNEALALLMRWQAAPTDSKAREEIRRFCAEGEAHLAAWESAKRLYRLTGEATGAPVREKERRRRSELTRRSIVGGLGALAVGTAALKGPDLWRRWQADMVSDVGVIAQHRLADGTKLTLGPDSAIRVAFSPTLRRVDLLDGMALLEAADDPRRPFEAHTGGFIARAAGSSILEIRQNSGRSVVAVAGGQAIVEKEGKPAGSGLAAGDWIAADPGDGGLKRGHRGIPQIAAWRNRQLIADEERIGAVVAEIARWQSARVVIADWGLSASRVSGLYDLSDPDAALQAVVSPYGGRVRRITPWLKVLSSV
jgi:transmembrane sensor